jgi:hypothetical protein
MLVKGSLQFYLKSVFDLREGMSFELASERYGVSRGPAQQVTNDQRAIRRNNKSRNAVYYLGSEQFIRLTSSCFDPSVGSLLVAILITHWDLLYVVLS